MKNWIKLAMAGSLGLILWGGSTTAHAAKKVTLPEYPQQRIFTFKAKGTKVYSYPRAAYAKSTVLGTDKSTTKQWTVDKVIKVNGKRYVRLAKVTTKALPHGTAVPNPSKANTTLVGGYVALSQLKFHQQISKLTSVKKTAYWTPTTNNDFWNMPKKTLGTTAANHYGHSYGYRTLYAIQSLTTINKKQYLYFETAAGKAIGWLPVNAVIKGTYPNLLQRELTRDLAATTATTTVDEAGHVKVGVATANGNVQRVVLLQQDSQTAIYDFQAGKAVKLTNRNAHGKVVSSQAFTQSTKNLNIKAHADFDIQGYRYTVKVAPTGSVSVLSTGGWIA
ncbi:GW dipeptide domain-containing protein [Levilactobacillus enshiensis]|uniref:GW dipeptide domain-containing protein n=1 Tax=Levilactobacillus enshiensis TaxID=2590213 RepID=UPI00117A9A08|nr:GW dipeptide domain-containing protein [Levilactobacillus enshiensis]